MSLNDWTLRMVHEGQAGLVLERQGRRIRFDPVGPLLTDDIVVLTGADPFAPERAIGFHTVVRANGKAEVDTEIDGVRFEGVPYEPPQREGGIRRVGAAVRQPGEAARRWFARRRPDVSTIWRLTFPNGDVLVHLGLSIHEDSDVGWAADMVTRFGGPRWLVVGVPFGQEQAVARRVPAIGAAHVIITDLEGDLRRASGRPTALVTPLADSLETAGVPTMVFVPASSVRFE
jgi:hypothetical protein